ncbi:hypothetical protein CWD08_21365 [Salmonella enterica]|nr:hypothetical protein [Salmonella enterica]
MVSVVVSGILKSPDGAVVAGAQIILTALTTSPDVLSGASASAVTTSAGYYGLTVLPGNYALTVSARGKSQVYGRVTLDGSETNVTLNMLLRRNLVEVSIPGELLTGFRQIQNNVADDLAAMQQLATDVSGKNDMASRSASDAAASAESAARSEENAGKSAASVLQSEQNAHTSAQSASGSALSAKTSEDNARKSVEQVSQSAESARLAAESAARDVAPAAAEQIRLSVRDDADRAQRAAEQTVQSASGVKQMHDDVETVIAESTRQAQQAGQSALSASQSEASARESARQSAAGAVASEDSNKVSALSAQAAAASEKKAATSEQNAGASERNAKSSEDAAVHAASVATEQAEIATNAAKTATKDAVATAVPEAARQIKTEIADDVNRAEAAASSAEGYSAEVQQALEDAKGMVTLPGFGEPGSYVLGFVWSAQADADFLTTGTTDGNAISVIAGGGGPGGIGWDADYDHRPLTGRWRAMSDSFGFRTGGMAFLLQRIK